MKKYRLLKDLPNFKAGEILNYEQCVYSPEDFPDWFEPFNDWPKTWDELDIKYEYTFAKQKQAASALAFAKLSQLANAINGDWVADWDNVDQKKYAVSRISNKLHIECCIQTFYHIIFHSRESAEFSLKHHRELWEKYYMLCK